MFNKTRVVPSLVFVCSFAFYVFSLAPTTLWGDDAKFQLFGYQLYLNADEIGHPLYVAVAHIFSLLPIGDLAWRINLASAALAALTLVFVFMSAQALTNQTVPSMAATISFGVSHTFWSFAVRPQAHALNSLFVAALIFGALRWRGSRKEYLFWCYTFGLGLTNHVLLGLVLPGIAWLFYMRARTYKFGWLSLASGSVAVAAGFLPFLILAALQGHVGRTVSLTSTALELLTLQTPVRDTSLWLGFALYNFAGAAVLLCGLGAARLWHVQRTTLVGIGLIYVISVGFVFDSKLPDQYKYYIPSYMALALLVGPGYQAAEDWLRPRIQPRRLTTLLPVLALAPIVIYHLAPQALHSAGIGTLLDVRSLPYRDALDFYLQPSRRGDDGAARFAEEALTLAAPDAVLVGDHTPLAPVRFTQVTEGTRLDVSLYDLPSSGQAAALAALSRGRTVYLLDVQKYYEMEPIEILFVVEPVGVLYRLIPRAVDNP